MEVTSTGKINAISFNGRLHKEDIVRLPSKKTNKPDYYVHTNNHEHKSQNSTFWKSLFTALTFGLTGLYIAHRNNLFNPVKREAKKIIQSEALQTEVKNFIERAISPETYKLTTQKALKDMSLDKTRGKEFMEEAQKVLTDEKAFDELFQKVSKRLADDKNETRLKQGYAVDVIDKLAIMLEKDFTKAKNHGIDYKGKPDDIIKSLISKTEDTPSKMEQALHEVIANRSAFTMESFIKDSMINSKLGKS